MQISCIFNSKLNLETKFLTEVNIYHRTVIGKLASRIRLHIEVKLNVTSHRFYSSGSQRSREPKQVMFSDGIRPGGDLTELDGASEPKPLQPVLKRTSRTAKKVEKTENGMLLVLVAVS